MENNDSQMSDALDWNSVIYDDGRHSILQEGDYEFKVTEVTRGWHNGSEKVEPCNKAILTLQIDHCGLSVNVRCDLLLSKSLEWKLASFFRCIRLKREGEPFVMDWNRVLGSTGKAHIVPKTYTNRYGEQREVNNVAYFIDPPNTNVASNNDDEELSF